jgi:hypothetical protein
MLWKISHFVWENLDKELFHLSWLRSWQRKVRSCELKKLKVRSWRVEEESIFHSQEIVKLSYLLCVVEKKTPSEGVENKIFPILSLFTCKSNWMWNTVWRWKILFFSLIFPIYNIYLLIHSRMNASTCHCVFSLFFLFLSKLNKLENLSAVGRVN